MKKFNEHQLKKEVLLERLKEFIDNLNNPKQALLLKANTHPNQMGGSTTILQSKTRLCEKKLLESLNDMFEEYRAFSLESYNNVITIVDEKYDIYILIDANRFTINID